MLEGLEEGVDDPIIFKVIFTAGGPGSGKSYALKQIGTEGMGFVTSDIDSFYTRLLSKAGMRTDPETIFSPEGQKIRGKAKSLSGTLRNTWIDGRKGIVIDGTGKDYDKVEKMNKYFKSLGYDTKMIFVNTNLDTSLKRNKLRDRQLKDNEVIKMHRDVQDNIGKFQRLFGNDLIIIDNSDGSNLKSDSSKIHGQIRNWSREIPKNSIAQSWIKSQGGRIGYNK